MTIIGLLVFLIVVGLLFWAVKAISGAFGIPPPVVVVIQVILVILAILYILQAIGAPLPMLKLR
jgi:hypothetical protein